MTLQGADSHTFWVRRPPVLLTQTEILTRKLLDEQKRNRCGDENVLSE